MPMTARTSTLVATALCTSSSPTPLATAAAGSTTLSSRNASLGRACAGSAPPSTFCVGSSRPVCSPLRTMNRNSALNRTGLIATAVKPMSVKIGKNTIAFFTPSRFSTQGAMNRLTPSCTA